VASANPEGWSRTEVLLGEKVSLAPGQEKCYMYNIYIYIYTQTLFIGDDHSIKMADQNVSHL
jgi:hypothetical protein